MTIKDLENEFENDPEYTIFRPISEVLHRHDNSNISPYHNTLFDFKAIKEQANKMLEQFNIYADANQVDVCTLLVLNMKNNYNKFRNLGVYFCVKKGIISKKKRCNKIRTNLMKMYINYVALRELYDYDELEETYLLDIEQDTLMFGRLTADII